MRSKRPGLYHVSAREDDYFNLLFLADSDEEAVRTARRLAERARDERLEDEYCAEMAMVTWHVRLGRLVPDADGSWYFGDDDHGLYTPGNETVCETTLEYEGKDEA